MMTRRAMLSKLALGVAAAASGSIPVRFGDSRVYRTPSLSSREAAFLEDLERASFSLFRDCAHPVTGLVLNSAQPDFRSGNAVASIAATGFGLTALCIGEQRGWLKPDEALARARLTLRFLRDKLPHEHGFFYHFVDWADGARAFQSEVSSIDTAILLCGVLTCRQHFGDLELQELATKIYERVDWQWMFQAGPCLSHGWTPEDGFLKAQWDVYCEHMMLYLLAIGAPQHAIPADAWHAWQRPWTEYAGIRYIDIEAPLFIHQYSHAWFDFRDKADLYADYFENSILATRAHRQFCQSLRDEFPLYSDELWGITASDSPNGYAVWGGPPRQGPIDGSVVPSATAGSLPFLPTECLQVLQSTRERFGKTAWNRYGLVDAFNPLTGWTAPRQIAINSGISLLMAENARTGFIWNTFMKNPEVPKAMSLAGFTDIA
jgi:hypothetical protein